MKRGVVWAVLLAVAGIFGISGAHAATFDSPNFKINGSLGDSMAGAQSSTNYRMVSAGGQSISGDASSDSYRLGMGYVSKLEKSLQLNTQPSGLEAYWSLDEQSGAVAYDSSANNRNGSYNNSPSIVAGKINSARSFNGSSQGMLAPDFDISGTITYSAWFYSTSAGQSSKIIAKNSATTDAQALLGLTSGQLFSVTTVGGTGQFIYGPYVPLNKWIHAAVTYDGSNTRLYVDGVERASFATTGAIANNNHSWGIGRNGNNSGGYLNGAIDEVKIYSRALNAEEIKSEYRAGASGLSTAGLNLGTITAGSSKTATFDNIVQTDAAGYSLSINQNHDLNTEGELAPQKSDSYGTASPGAALTTLNTSADAIVTANTGTAIAHNSTNPLHGTYARFNSGGTASTAYQRDAVANEERVFARFYVRVDAIPSSTMTIWNMYNGSNSVSGVVIDSSGKIHLRNVFASIGSTNYIVSPGSWMRIEVMWDRTNSTQQMRLFKGSNVDGTVPDETLSGVANSTETSATSMRTGIVNGMTNHINDVDDLAYDTRDWIGPAIASNSISGVSGDITTPTVWSEGTVKGLGFTLYGTNSTAIPAKWNGGSNYAAMPGVPTSFYSRTGLSGGAKDVLNMRLRLDVPTAQAVGDYSNRMTITGTMVP